MTEDDRLATPPPRTIGEHLERHPITFFLAMTLIVVVQTLFYNI